MAAFVGAPSLCSARLVVEKDVSAASSSLVGERVLVGVRAVRCCTGKELRIVGQALQRDGVYQKELLCDSPRIFYGCNGGIVSGRRVSRLRRTVSVQASQKYKQNEDLPPSNVPNNKKKPFVRPIQHGSHAKRMRRREMRLLPPKPLKAPANGLLVKRLIPVAHMVYKAYQVVLDGVSRLLKHKPVRACRWCTEVYVGREGHKIKTCRGKNSTGRSGEHLWVTGLLEDIVVPVEAFHLVDRLQKPISHEDRFNHDRIPAIVELCIQAGVDLSEFPTMRRTVPIDRPGWDKIDSGDEYTTLSGLAGTSRGRNTIEEFFNMDDEKAETSASGGEEHSMVDVGDHKMGFLYETGEVVDTKESDDCDRSSESKFDVQNIDDDDDLKTIAEKTLRAWTKMRAGAAQLMQIYPVRACGYCPEVHIGRRGHKLQLCGAFKHQWRNGQHGWQDAALDDLIPSRYVWHVRDVDGPPLKNSLSKYYGKAPAIVELCVQSGAAIPTKYKPLMRLDVIVPDLDELEMVA